MIVKRKHEWELHCHSEFSDGKLSCPELFELAEHSGVSHLALTDHDTAAGYRAAVNQNWVPESLTLYPATELSCVWRGITIHVVGLGIDAFSERWLHIEQAYVVRREKRFQRILFLLGKKGLTLDENRIRELAAQGVPARPHIARYLVETGQVKDTGLAFKKWLGQGKPGDVKSQWPDLAEAVASIVECGGMAVLAHPHRYKLTWTKTRELLDEFTHAGGKALEVSCIGMDPEKRKFLVAQALERQMLVSGGSDFHSPQADWVKLGTFPEWPRHAENVTDWLLKKYAS